MTILLPELHRTWILLAGAFVGYLLVMLANPVRSSFRDGFRCMRRYGRLWTLLALFGLCYALFQIGVEVFCHYNLQEGQRPVFQWSRPWFLPASMRMLILKQSVLPALEGVAGIFNVLITTFPFSVIASVLFLTNSGGHHAVLLRALRRRFDGWGWVIYFGILLSALAALAKPFLYGPLLPLLNQVVPGLPLLQSAFIVDWLSFLFEIMFGVCVQIYLILLVYAWVRGLNFTQRHLTDFAIRRFSFVMKWSAIVMLVSSIFIHLPLILANVPPFSHYVSPDYLPYYVDHFARPFLAAFLIIFSGLQIILTFHSESLRRAIRDYVHFLRKEAGSICWFVVIAFIHFYFLNVINGAVSAGFATMSDETMSMDYGSGTAITLAWRLFCPLLTAFVGGWMLATWVCLYKRSEAGRVHGENWIKF